MFKSNLFKDVGRIYISSQCRVARTDLRELVVLAGGRLVNTARVAEVVVGEFCHVGDSTSPHFVTDHWLLDFGPAPLSQALPGLPSHLTSSSSLFELILLTKLYFCDIK